MLLYHKKDLEHGKHFEIHSGKLMSVYTIAENVQTGTEFQAVLTLDVSENETPQIACIYFTGKPAQAIVKFDEKHEGKYDNTLCVVGLWCPMTVPGGASPYSHAEGTYFIGYNGYIRDPIMKNSNGEQLTLVAGSICGNIPYKVTDKGPRLSVSFRIWNYKTKANDFWTATVYGDKAYDAHLWATKGLFCSALGKVRDSDGSFFLNSDDIVAC